MQFQRQGVESKRHTEIGGIPTIDLQRKLRSISIE